MAQVAFHLWEDSLSFSRYVAAELTVDGKRFHCQEQIHLTFNLYENMDALEAAKQRLADKVRAAAKET